MRNELCVEFRYNFERERAYRCSCHTADDEVASASENRFRHDAVMRCVFGPRGEASCFLCDYDPCLYPPQKLHNKLRVNTPGKYNDERKHPTAL
jgi:hypothetical protein